MNTPAAGWYPDPQDPTLSRYWDGVAWTEHTQPAAPAAPPSYNPQPGYAQPGYAQPGFAQPGFAQPGYSQSKPDNYLIWAILSTVLCCLPFGIASIVNATKVDNLWNQGLFDDARQRSAKAKRWAIVAAVAGPVLSIVFYVIMGILAANSGATY